MHSDNEYDIESLRMRERNINEERGKFLKYSTISIAIIVIIAITKSNSGNELELGIFGGVIIPRSLILSQIFVVKTFLVLLLTFSFIGWVLAIIDINKHPLYKYYRGQKSFVIRISDIWDDHIWWQWLSLQNILDFLQKILFLSLVIFVLLQLILI